MLHLLYSLTPVAHAAASFVGGIDTNGNGFFGISFGSGAVNCFSGTVCGLAQTIIFTINNVLVPVLFAVAFIVFLYGVAEAYIFSRGDPERVKNGHRLILWGLIGFVVMLSVWGLVNIVANSVGVNGYTAPPLPQSY